MPTLPLRLGNILHQPVDGVVGIGGVVDGRRVLRAVQRAVHDVVALGAVLAAHVLHHADVAAFDDHVGGVVIAVQDRPEVRALGVARELGRVIGRARQQDRRALRSLRNKDDGVQLDAVAHGDHDLAPGRNRSYRWTGSNFGPAFRWARRGTWPSARLSARSMVQRATACKQR